MAICINESSVQYQSLKERAGISEPLLKAICRKFLEKQGRFPYLDELPYSNSELYLRKLLNLTKYNSTKISSILEFTGEETLDKAVINLNDQFRDLEITITPIQEEAIVDIIHRPTTRNFSALTEEEEILSKAPRNSEGKLLAPNGKPTKLTDKQYALVRTKAFKNWFGDWINNPSEASKVVDENGEPLIVYHGTPNKWSILDPSKFGLNTDEGYYGRGLYLSSVENKAAQYGDIMSLFVNIKNPLRVGIDKNITMAEAVKNVKLAELFNRNNTLEELNRFDGVLYSGSEGMYEEIVVPGPNQIKSATDNTGLFSKATNNIYDPAPNSYLVLLNALLKLASLHGVTFNNVTEAELNSEKWKGIIPDGSFVNGFIYDGLIYINMDRASLDTPIHEMFHLFIGSLRFTNPKLYLSLTQSVESLSNYSELAKEYEGRTRNDVNEEILVTEVSKYLIGQNSNMLNLDNKILYEISYNINRMLDTILMGKYSAKTIPLNILETLSLKEIAQKVLSSIMDNTFHGTFNVAGSELHRRLNNVKSDLYKEGSLKEYCD